MIARAAPLLACWLLAACARGGDPHAVARWRGGSLSLTELDAHLLTLRRTPDAPAIDPAFARGQVLELFARRALPSAELRQRILDDPDFQRIWRARENAILTRALLGRHNDSFEVTVEQAREAFERQRPRLQSAEQRIFRHLFLAYPLDATSAQRAHRCAEAEGLRSQVLGGASFEDLATRHSDSANAIVGGLVGPVVRAQLRGEVAAAVFTLAPGGVSAVLRNAAGCHLFLVQQIVPAIPPRFELYRDRLIAELAEERRFAWRVELLRDQAHALSVALPGWLDPATPPPADLAADQVVVALPDEDILGRDVLAGLGPGQPAARVLADLLQTRLLPGAARAQIPATEWEPLLAREREEQIFLAASGRELERWVAAERAGVVQAHFAANPARHTTDPQVEASLYSWPIGPGDPIDALRRPRAFASAIAGGEAPTSAWERFAADPGARHESFPQASVRALVVRRPELAPALGRELAEGQALGPFRTGGRLLVTVITVLVPARPLSFLEAEAAAQRDLIAERGNELRREWLEDLGERRRLWIDEAALSRLGPRLAGTVTPP